MGLRCSCLQTKNLCWCCGGSLSATNGARPASTSGAVQSRQPVIGTSRTPNARRLSVSSRAKAVSAEFELEVQSIDGTLWKLDGVSVKHTAGLLKKRLRQLDVRFRTHCVSLACGSHVFLDTETLGDCGIAGNANRLVAVFSDLRVTALIVGGGVAGRTAAHELSSLFPDKLIALVDPQEFSEHTFGIVRAYADPAAWDALVVRHEDALQGYGNVRFVQGEVTQLRADSAAVSAADGSRLIVRFEFCVIAVGCSFAPVSISTNCSLWQPSATSAARENTPWSTLDERAVAGRRRHVLEEHKKLWAVHDRGGTVVVVGADYQGVEWACDLIHYFPGLRIYLVDVLPRCLSTLPADAAAYAERHMHEKGIRTFYNVKGEPDSSEFWSALGLQQAADLVYVLRGIRAHNSFMPPSTLSARGPGGGGWVLTNTSLQVCARKSRDRPAQVWAEGRVFAVGDCHYGAVESATSKEPVDEMTERFDIPPLPKTAFAAICWAQTVCRNIGLLAKSLEPQEATWPTDAGILAVGLGPNDGVAVWDVMWTRDSGEIVLQGKAAAEMKQRLIFSGDRMTLANPNLWLDIFQEGVREISAADRDRSISSWNPRAH